MATAGSTVQGQVAGLPVWVVQAWRDRGLCVRCGGAGESVWAGTGETLCWSCVEVKREAGMG